MSFPDNLRGGADNIDVAGADGQRDGPARPVQEGVVVGPLVPLPGDLIDQAVPEEEAVPVPVVRTDMRPAESPFTRLTSVYSTSTLLTPTGSSVWPST